MKKLIASLLLCAAPLLANADEYGRAIDIRTDKIVINTDSLDMPKSTTAYEILTLLPDLVERNSEFILNNYTIQINGKTVGSARDAVLQQIRIDDLKCIEVSENSLSAMSALGQGGSISLELRDATSKLTGSVNAEVTTEANYSGGLRLDKNYGKWNFRTVGTIENYVPRDVRGSNSHGTTGSTTNRDFSEFASAFIEYHPTVNDLLKLNLTETYTNSRHSNEAITNGVVTDINDRTRNFNAFLGFNYEHTFPTTGKLCLELNYRYTPEKFDNHRPNYEDSYDHSPNNTYGELKLEQPFFRPTANRMAMIKLGTQYSYSSACNTSEGYRAPLTSDADIRRLDIDEKTYYLRPFVELEAQLNKWRFYGVIDYQHFSYKTNEKNNDKDKAHNRREDITGQAVVIFQPDKRHSLRLRFLRTIDRPSTKQIYPYAFVLPDYVDETYSKGNMSLVPTRQNTLDMDYSLDLSSDSHHLELKAGVEYSHCYDIIREYMLDANTISYHNSDKMDILMGDLGMYYRKGFFSAWFSGNVYHNHESNDNHYTYYNLLLRPVFNLPHQWMVSLSTIYNSAINKPDADEGYRFFGILRVGKTWKHINAYAYWKQNFIGQQHDVSYSTTGSGTEVINYMDYDYMISCIGLGVRYSF